MMQNGLYFPLTDMFALKYARWADLGKGMFSN